MYYTKYVHLSSDNETTIQVGKRRDEIPILFKIDEKQESIDEVQFCHANDMIWRVDSIDPKYLIEE